MTHIIERSIKKKKGKTIIMVIVSSINIGGVNAVGILCVEGVIVILFIREAACAGVISVVAGKKVDFCVWQHVVMHSVWVALINFA